MRALQGATAELQTGGAVKDAAQDLSFETISETDSPVVRLVASTLYDAIKAGADYGMAERQKTQPAIAIGSLDAAALRRFGQVGIAGEQPPAGGLDVVVDTVAIAGIEHLNSRRRYGGIEHAVGHGYMLGNGARRA